MDRRAMTTPTEFRADESAGRVIEGYFAVFGSDYKMGNSMSESIDPHAFDGTLSGDVRALINHDTALVLGRTTVGTLELKVDARGLWGKILINEHDQDAVNLYERVKRGDVSQCSFGFDITDEESTIRDDGSVHWTIKGVRLYEVSVCTFPAYEETSVNARAADAVNVRRSALDAWKAKMRGKLKNA